MKKTKRKSRAGRPTIAVGGCPVQLNISLTEKMREELAAAVGENTSDVHAWIRELIDQRLESISRAGPGVLGKRYIDVAIPEELYPFLKNAAIRSNGMTDARYILWCVQSALKGDLCTLSNSAPAAD